MTATTIAFARVTSAQCSRYQRGEYTIEATADLLDENDDGFEVTISADTYEGTWDVYDADGEPVSVTVPDDVREALITEAREWIEHEATGCVA